MARTAKSEGDDAHRHPVHVEMRGVPPLTSTPRGNEFYTPELRRQSMLMGE